MTPSNIRSKGESKTRTRSTKNIGSSDIKKKPTKYEETMTVTQLRNARKRLAKMKKTRQSNRKSSNNAGTHSYHCHGNGDVNVDPSAQYLKKPDAAPLVQAAKRFFASRLEPKKNFPIYQYGPTTGWRTVSKLPVRQVQLVSKQEQPIAGDVTGNRDIINSNNNNNNNDNLQKKKNQFKTRVVIGMFQPKTHQVSMGSHDDKKKKSLYLYPAHHPSINHMMTLLTKAVPEMGVDVYNETTGTGFLRFVAMNVERATCQVQLTLIWNDSPYWTTEPENARDIPNKDNGDQPNWSLLMDSAKKKNKKRKRSTNSSEKESSPAVGKSQLERLILHLLKRATTSASEKGNNGSSNSNSGSPSVLLHSLWVHYNATWKHSNAIFDIHATSKDSWQHIYGPKTIPEQLACDGSSTKIPTLHFAPNVFRQANLDAFAYIIKSIKKRLQSQFGKGASSKATSCLELYGGVGTIGLHLLDLTCIHKLICSDENPFNQHCFSQSLTSLANGDSKKATYVPQNALAMVSDSRDFLKQSQVVIVDPPRKGLDDTVLDALTNRTRHKLQLLVYVSCGFDAFQRDYARLTEPQGNNNDNGQRHLWKLDHAEGHILFPGSNAIETLAFFVPVSGT